MIIRIVFAQLYPTSLHISRANEVRATAEIYTALLQEGLRDALLAIQRIEMAGHLAVRNADGKSCWKTQRACYRVALDDNFIHVSHNGIILIVICVLQ